METEKTLRLCEEMRVAGKTYKQMAEILNSSGLNSKSGKAWTEGSLQKFISREKRDTQNQSATPRGDTDLPAQPITVEENDTMNTSEITAVPMPDTSALAELPISAPSPDTNVLVELVDSFKEGRLREMLDWYEHTSRIPGGVMRPEFVGEKKNTGILISRKILLAAQAKQLSEVKRVGRSFSQLIEFLLWEYAGRPAELVAGATAQALESEPPQSTLDN